MSSGKVVYIWSINVTLAWVTLVGSLTIWYKPYALRKSDHLDGGYCKKSILRSPYIIILGLIAMAFTTSFSKSLNQETETLGGLYMKQI